MQRREQAAREYDRHLQSVTAGDKAKCAYRRPLVSPRAMELAPHCSPDGKRIAFDVDRAGNPESRGSPRKVG